MCGSFERTIARRIKIRKKGLLGFSPREKRRKLRAAERKRLYVFRQVPCLPSKHFPHYATRIKKHYKNNRRICRCDVIIDILCKSIHRKKTERSEQFLRLAMCGSFERTIARRIKIRKKGLLGFSPREKRRKLRVAERKRLCTFREVPCLHRKHFLKLSDITKEHFL